MLFVFTLAAFALTGRLLLKGHDELMSETSKDGDRVEGGKGLFLSQCEALDRRLHRGCIICDSRDRKPYETTHLIHDY